MRVLLRLCGQDDTFPTFDLPATATVRELKQMVQESGQSDLLPRSMRMFLGGALLVDDSPLGTHAQGGSTPLHVLLRGPVPARTLTPIAAACSWTRLGNVVTMALRGGCTELHAGQATMEVRDSHESLVPGSVVLQPAQLRWLPLPATPLMPATEYTVYITGAIECSWRFISDLVAPVRLRVSRQDPEQPGHHVQKLIQLDRTFGLLAELHARIMASFHLSAADQVVTSIVVTAGHRPVDTDRDVGKLAEFEQLTFCVAPRPRQLSPPAMPAAGSAAAAAAYAETHWVNPQAGFYALCGKMSAEDETAALLDIVRAFAAGDAFSGAPAAAPARQVARAERPSGGGAEPRQKKPRQAAACGCASADMTTSVIPKEQIHPLWGSGATFRPPIFDEDDLHVAAAHAGAAQQPSFITQTVSSELKEHG